MSSDAMTVGDAPTAASAGQRVTVRYFAWVRERVGRAEEQIALPADVATVGELARWLATRGPEYAEAFRRADVVRAALDQVHVKPSAPLAGAREVAFFPPVTGG
ncbi:MAG TPA: molybdopterin converting factor subunit 1 [Hyphomicrobium sp.]|nr:molybdopterin converting factor subunit 1 [Hyphomicrobium sp.]HRO48634.1 molybdopterin converting factor subunit 1 [Hyphomicrobium sp.]